MILAQSKADGVNVSIAGERDVVRSEIVAVLVGYVGVVSENPSDEDSVMDLLAEIAVQVVANAKRQGVTLRAAALRRS